MTTWKTFFGKLLIILSILILADIGIGGLLQHYYFRITYGELGRLTYVIDSLADPVVVLGSSRAAHGYKSDLIADSLHLDCYNAGKDKQGLFYSLAIATSVMHRYHPRFIIADLHPVAFITSESALDDLAVLLPYYRKHPEIRPIVDKISRWEKLKTLSSLYCYNSLVLQIIYNSMSAGRKDDAVRGYIPKWDSLNHIPSPPFSPQQLTDTPDSALVRAFGDIITLAKENSCRLAVVVSPLYFPLPGGSSTIRLAKAICDRQQIPILDYSRSATFAGKPALFYDEMHLNDAGAQLFTSALYSDLAAKGFWEKNE